MNGNNYLQTILTKYSPKSLTTYSDEITLLKDELIKWSSKCYFSILDSGSRAKGTAISISSDVDYLISLKSTCNENNGGLKGIYESLFKRLELKYNPVRKQNVSFRIKIRDLEVDITPARKLPISTNFHWLYVSKFDTWRQTNIQIHINEISKSGRLEEIKLLKIWRELNNLDFPSIYLEYIVLNCLKGKSKNANNLESNFISLLKQLSQDTNNPLFSRIIDPANSTNILSDLLSKIEKETIISTAKVTVKRAYWEDIVW